MDAVILIRKHFGKKISQENLQNALNLLTEFQELSKKQFSLNSVGCSLPSRDEMNVEGLKGFKEMLKEDAATSKYDYSKGFINCFDWLSEKLKK